MGCWWRDGEQSLAYRGLETGKSRVKTKRHQRKLFKTLDIKEVEGKPARGDLVLRPAFYYQKT